jgi:hypothetical protein
VAFKDIKRLADVFGKSVKDKIIKSLNGQVGLHGGIDARVTTFVCEKTPNVPPNPRFVKINTLFFPL